MEITATKATFQKYPAYKDSGEYWMGEIPEHWEIKKLKHVFKEKKKVTNPNLNCGSISFGKVVYKEDEKIPESTKASYQEVLAGEYLVNPLNLNYDLISLRIGLSDINVVVSSGYIVLQNAIKLDKSYFNYLLHRYDVAYMKLLGSGVRQTISFNHIANSLLAFPPKEEQAAIANFLDDKTSKIDRAIAQKERMIELLKERKQIIIQNAVTKGLDPNVKMKDSGVEWIGEIPEHWEVLNFRYLIDVLTDYTANGSFGDLAKNVIYLDEPSYSRLIRLTDLRKGLKTQGVFLNKKSHSYLSKSELFGGELLMANVGAYAGLAWIMPKISKPATLGPNMFLIKPKQHLVSSKYLETLINAEVYWNYITVIAQSAAQPKLNKDNIREIKIVLPPKNEQEFIINHLSDLSVKFQELITMQQIQIEKLKEYKTSLIDSAVTGKIKVS